MADNDIEPEIVNHKRGREEEAADGQREGPDKKAKVDEHPTAGAEPPANDGEPAERSAAVEETPEEAAPAVEATPPSEATKEPEQEARDEPKKVGYKVFKDGKEAALYYRTLLSHLTKGQNLNEYEFNMVLELIKTGHPDPASKLGCGVKSIQVREHDSGGSNCFYLIRTDGSVEDFSTWKCIKSLFPAFGAAQQPERDNWNGGKAGRGRGRGRGGGGGGRRGRGRRGGRR